MKMKTVLGVVALGAALSLASVAQAAVVTVELARGTGDAGWTEEGYIDGLAEFEGDAVPGGRNRRAGEMRYTTLDVQGDLPNGVSFSDIFDTFCVQLGVPAVSGGTGVFHLVSATDYFSDSAVVTNLGRLIASFAGQIGSSQKFNAAFQLAIWEIVYDSANLDLLAGPGFRAIDDFSSARTLASEMLATVQAMTGSGSEFYILRGEYQDLLVLVPEPGTLLLIGSALLLGGAVRRKSRAAA